jgi:valine dehydrogenase (NAD+)
LAHGPSTRSAPWPPISSTSRVTSRSPSCTDPDTGLRAIIALHDTSLGPGLGGTRFHPYPSTDQALADVLRLSRAMTSKNAVAGLDHGGGKAVIIGDPQRDKTPELLRAYGRFVESLGGRYVTACDVGTYVPDMDVVGESTRWATGRSRSVGAPATPRC